MKPSRCWTACLAAAALLSSHSVWSAPPKLRLNGSGGVGYDSNIGASQASEEKVDSAFYSLLLAADYVWPVGEYFSFTVRGQVQGDAYDRFDDLSNARALGLLRASWKPGGSFFAPVLSAWGSSAHLEYGSRIRTGNEYRGGVFALQQLTTNVSLRTELKGFHRRSEGRVFDLSGQSAGLSLSWAPSPRLSGSLGFEYQTGDATSSASPSLRIVQAAEVIEADDAFGGVDANQFAYRIDARTRIVTAGVNWRLARDLAVDAQLQSVSVDADFGNQYDRLIAVVGLLKRF